MLHLWTPNGGSPRVLESSGRVDECRSESYAAWCNGSRIRCGGPRCLEGTGYDLGYSQPDNQHHEFSLHGIDTDAIKGVWVPGNDRVLKETEVVNIHPTVHFSKAGDDDKYGWLGITDNVVITPEGGQLLTHDTEFSEAFIELSIGARF